MNFDLNINNYKKKELKEMFDLPSNYDKQIVEIKESKLRESILNNKEINDNTRMKTVYFLTEAKKILLGDVYQKVENAEEKVKDYFNSIYDLLPPNYTSLIRFISCPTYRILTIYLHTVLRAWYF